MEEGELPDDNDNVSYDSVSSIESISYEEVSTETSKENSVSPLKRKYGKSYPHVQFPTDDLDYQDPYPHKRKRRKQRKTYGKDDERFDIENSFRSNSSFQPSRATREVNNKGKCKNRHEGKRKKNVRKRNNSLRQRVISKSGPSNLTAASDAVNSTENSLMKKLIGSGTLVTKANSASSDLKCEVGSVSSISSPDLDTFHLSSDDLDSPSNILTTECSNETEKITCNINVSDDSDIEVIIPEKKVPPLVLLNSDGEEDETILKPAEPSEKEIVDIVASSLSSIPDDNLIEESCKSPTNDAIIISCEENNESSVENNEEDEDILQLRLIALQSSKDKSKSDQIQVPDKVYEPEQSQNSQSTESQSEGNSARRQSGDDDLLLKLRMEALKSAVLRKHKERLKKGIKIRKQHNLESEDLENQSNTSSPYSPSDSIDVSYRGEEDMEIAESDVEGEIVEVNNICEVQPVNALVSTDTWNETNTSCSPTKPNESFYGVSYQNNPLPTSKDTLIYSQPLPPGVDPVPFEKPTDTFCSQFELPSVDLLPIPPPPPPPTVLSLLPPPPPPPLSPAVKINSNMSMPYSNVTNYDQADNESIKYTENFQETHFNPLPQTFEHGSSYVPLSTNYCTLNNNTEQCDELCTIDNSQDFINSGSVSAINPKHVKSRPNLLQIPLSNIVKKNEPTPNKQQWGNKIISNYFGIKSNSKRKRKNKLSKAQNNVDSPEDNITQVKFEATNATGSTEIYNTISCSSVESNLNILNEANLVETKNIKDSVLVKAQNESQDASDIDMNEMIILDEVGMSPDNKSSDIACGRAADDEEDLDKLREKVLTSIANKTDMSKTNVNNVETVTLKPILKQTKENYPNVKNKNITFVNRKTLDNFPRLPDVENSRYRLTRTLINEPVRNVTKGQSLTVVIPSEGLVKKQNTASQISPPQVQKMIINVGQDSDTDEDHESEEWYRRVMVKNNNENLDVEKSVEMFLSNIRREHETVTQIDKGVTFQEPLEEMIEHLVPKVTEFQVTGVLSPHRAPVKRISVEKPVVNVNLLNQKPVNTEVQSYVETELLKKQKLLEPKIINPSVSMKPILSYRAKPQNNAAIKKAAMGKFVKINPQQILNINSNKVSNKSVDLVENKKRTESTDVLLQTEVANITVDNSVSKSGSDKVSLRVEQSVEDLHQAEKELLTGRYNVIDELTEMNNLLGEYEKEKEKLSNSQMELVRLQKELSLAEGKVKQQKCLTLNIQNEFIAAYTKMIAGTLSCEQWEKACAKLGGQINGTKYEIPSGGKKLLAKKLQQVSDRTKKLNIKQTKSTAKAVGSKNKQLQNTVNKSVKQTLLEKVDPKIADSTMRQTEINNKPNTCASDASCSRDNDSRDAISNDSLCSTSKINSECQKVDENLETNKTKVILEKSEHSDKSTKPSELLVTQNCEENVSSVAPSVISDVIIEKSGEDNQKEKSVVKTRSQNRVSNYVSPLQHFGMSQKGQGNPKDILCPYDLMGRCVDDSCRYRHHKTQV